MIPNVRFHGRISKNGREYSDKAMWQLKKLYETVDISIDHGSTGVKDLFGTPVNLRMNDRSGREIQEGQGTPWEIRGDTKILCSKSSEIYETVKNCVDEAPHLLKFSHEVPVGRYRRKIRRNEPELIEQVYEVRRIALITGNGGVNNSLFEKKEESMDEIRESSDVKEQYPAIYEQIIKEATPTILESCGCRSEGGALEQVVTLKTQIEDKEKTISELQEQLDVYKAAEDAQKRRESIRDRAKELKHVLSDDILESLLSFPDTEDGNAHIDRLIKTQPALTEEGDSTKETPEEKPSQKPPKLGGTQEQTQPRYKDPVRNIASQYLHN